MSLLDDASIMIIYLSRIKVCLEGRPADADRSHNSNTQIYYTKRQAGVHLVTLKGPQPQSSRW